MILILVLYTVVKYNFSWSLFYRLYGGSALFKNNDLLNELSQTGSIFACNITYN